MSKQEVILCRNFGNDLINAIKKCPHDRLFVLTDENTHKHCLLNGKNIFPQGEMYQEIIIGADDVNKTLETLASVWQALSQQGASRHSLLINLGGGMVTDLGGFAASTFKRGISYINIPTTLLSMVDASVGGKTGINFNGLKNEIGVFSPASSVLIETAFLQTLDTQNILSGFAEMLKHGLISTQTHLDKLLTFDIEHIDYEALKQMVGRSVAVKERIVEEDPKEHGIRKALNLGHTIGHGIEAALPYGELLHGEAVSLGLRAALFLSRRHAGLSAADEREVLDTLRALELPLTLPAGVDIDRALALTASDKKFRNGSIRFVLLRSLGEPVLSKEITKDDLRDAIESLKSE